MISGCYQIVKFNRVPNGDLPRRILITFVDIFHVSSIHFSITDLTGETILGIEYNFQSTQIM
jgi:hypothetical protein